ncbi:hypothetical protein HMPREF9554_02307 [Treponema phagedenis F0421]|nr:hypothetical protein HMPREF9554_02307 [Treponema phagedenis F0421]
MQSKNQINLFGKTQRVCKNRCVFLYPWQNCFLRWKVYLLCFARKLKNTA